MIILHHKTLKLIKNILLVMSISIGFFPVLSNAKEIFKLQNPSGELISLRLAITPAEHTKGLSGIKPNNFSEKEGMLFINKDMGKRRFWMPDTFFNLDIIFINQNLAVVALEKNVPFHKGISEPPAIYRTQEYHAQFILETKAGTKFSQNLKIGDKLIWNSKIPISEIVLKTRQQQ